MAGSPAAPLSRDTSPTTLSLLGRAFKGPLDGATTRIVDAAGNILATGGST
ncbi:MAG: hypothetical protein ACWA5X_03155 [bacterium]